ncbi:MAG: hypothetical protein AB7I18_01515 [Candidatus Berkiella sp.]
MSSTGPQSLTDILIECINQGFTNEALFAIELLKCAIDDVSFSDLNNINTLLDDPRHAALQNSFLPVFEKEARKHRQPLVPRRSPPLPPTRALSDLEKLQAQCQQSIHIDFSHYRGPS